MTSSLTVSAYERLRHRFRECVFLNSAGSVLGWDQETYLPNDGVAFRSEQLAYLSGQRHRLATAPEVGEWLAEMEASAPEAMSREGVNVRGWRRAYDRAVKLPVELVEELTRTTSVAQQAWAAARKASDFKAFKPHLEKLLSLTREKADAWGWQECRYDALLDEYEPGARTSELKSLFATLAPQISALIEPAVARSAKTPRNLLQGHYPLVAQQAFNREIAEGLGFDFSAGRIDTTTHPFCTGLGPRDVRLTTRYDESDFTSSLYGVMHEAGHGLYEQGLDQEDWGLPMGEAVSLGIHESQSRLWENHIGGSDAFWQHWVERARHHFPHLAKIAPEAIAAAAREVSPSFIRVEADEVTYDLHIALRFELETALIDGSLAVDDLPQAWNARFEQLLGLSVPDDARGCLQDVHWSFGLFGYFATYTLGNLNAAQLMRAARTQISGLDQSLAAGQYGPLLAWLRQNVHQHGHRYQPQHLMHHATGEPTQAHYHVEHLKAKFC